MSMASDIGEEYGRKEERKKAEKLVTVLRIIALARRTVRTPASKYDAMTGPRVFSDLPTRSAELAIQALEEWDKS